MVKAEAEVAVRSRDAVRSREVAVRSHLVPADVDLTVNQLSALRLRRLDDARVAMAGVCDANAAGEIEHRLAASRLNSRAGAAPHDELGRAADTSREPRHRRRRVERRLAGVMAAPQRGNEPCCACCAQCRHRLATVA